MLHGVSPLRRVAQISKQLQISKKRLVTMPLIAQNPNDRIILGLMTFGSSSLLHLPHQIIS